MLKPTIRIILLIGDISIHRSGLVIHKDDISLACSLDGFVKYVAQDGSCHNGIVEYKCPFSLADQKDSG
uniref:Uncharacterized protein n=1 Tax=Amphimedon queenslandica TaxID=400682 RepID=A0A1X7SXN6_AMPQE